MPRIARAAVLVVALAAASLAGTIAAAQAATRPLEPHLGETYQTRQAAPPSSGADAAVERLLARERFAVPNATPAQVTAPTPAGHGAQPDPTVIAVGVVAVLALVGGLALLASRRAGRRVRAGQTA
jgi:hypothetical protein